MLAAGVGGSGFCGRRKRKETYFMAAGTFAVEARDLMLAEIVLTSRAGPLFCARLLNDLHVCLHVTQLATQSSPTNLLHLCSTRHEILWQTRWPPNCLEFTHN